MTDQDSPRRSEVPRDPDTLSPRAFGIGASDSERNNEHNKSAPSTLGDGAADLPADDVEIEDGPVRKTVLCEADIVDAVLVDDVEDEVEETAASGRGGGSGEDHPPLKSDPPHPADSIRPVISAERAASQASAASRARATTGSSNTPTGATTGSSNTRTGATTGSLNTPSGATTGSSNTPTGSSNTPTGAATDRVAGGKRSTRRRRTRNPDRLSVPPLARAESQGEPPPSAAPIVSVSAINPTGTTEPNESDMSASAPHDATSARRNVADEPIESQGSATPIVPDDAIEEATSADLVGAAEGEPLTDVLERLQELEHGLRAERDVGVERHPLHDELVRSKLGVERDPDDDELEPAEHHSDQDILAPTQHQPDQDELEPDQHQPDQNDLTPTQHQPDQDQPEPDQHQPDQDDLTPTQHQPDQDQPDQDELEPDQHQPDEDEPTQQHPDENELEPDQHQPDQDDLTPTQLQPDHDQLELTEQHLDEDELEPDQHQPDEDEPTQQHPDEDALEPVQHQPDQDDLAPTQQHPDEDALEPVQHQPDEDDLAPTERHHREGAFESRAADRDSELVSGIFEADAPPLSGPSELLELRQIAGLTAGSITQLTEHHYDFAESADEVGFSITIDDLQRAIVTPGATPATIDAIPIDEPEILGHGVLDVGTARFIVRSRRAHKRAADWLDEHRESELPEPVIAVPADLPLPARARSGKRRRGRKNESGDDSKRATLDVRTWEFVETVREVRSFVAEQRRFLYPDPSELAARVAQSAPVLGVRGSGHDLFAKVGVVTADVPWLPTFDDIHAIPGPVGMELRPLLFLPSVPVVADLMMGPLGIVGSRSAAMACARHIMVSLYGLSTQDLRLHVVTGPDRADAWEWASRLAPDRPLAVGRRFSVVVIDGVDNYESAGFTHDDAIERRVGVVTLADSVDELPSYCGTVLQLESSGSGAVLTDHEGELIAGTPIGISTAVATQLADGLVDLTSRVMT